MGIDKTVTSVQMTVAARAVFAVLLSYRSNQAPSLSWWLPAELFLYSIVLDFWFYIYHRCCTCCQYVIGPIKSLIAEVPIDPLQLPSQH